jgi:hypothetical protein
MSETVQEVMGVFGPENTPYLYGNCAVNDVVLLLLYWMLYHASYHKLEKLSTFPHSNFNDEDKPRTQCPMYVNVEGG